jgi:NAD(P)-dependent dehydrogenase (short-subunit alcohol dehydrogenase family)
MRVVAVSSVSATEGWPGGAAYCAAKGALSALCRALDAELKPRGISVQAIEPRYVKTRMFDSCAGRMGVSNALARDPADLADEILKGITI